MSKPKTRSEMEQLIKIVKSAADNAEKNAAYGGQMNDGEASKIRTQAYFYEYGMELIMPKEWEEYEKEMDPEYNKYLELKKKFER